MDKQQMFYEKNYQKDMMSMSDKYDLFIKIMKSKIDKPIKNYLDFGCGDGSFMLECKKKLNIENAFGCDISSSAISLLKKTTRKCHVVNIDKEDLPYEDNFFDLMFCGEVIEHLYDPDRLLRELHRTCSDKGLVFLTTPNLASWFNRISLLLGYTPIFCDTSLQHSCGTLWGMAPLGHLRLYTLRGLKQLLQIHHFEILESVGIGINVKIGFGQTYPLFANIMNKLFSSPSINSGILIIIRPVKNKGGFQ